MSRTHRNAHKVGFYVYRYPKTFNERKQLESFLHDDEIQLRNRDKAKIHNLPTVHDDIVASGYYEDYSWKHYFQKSELKC